MGVKGYFYFVIENIAWAYVATLDVAYSRMGKNHSAIQL